MKANRHEKNKLILDLIHHKSHILHVGCTNSPRTIDRWDAGMILHKLLCDRAHEVGAKVVGIDIDQAAIDFLRERMPGEEIVNVDAHHLSRYFGEETKFDLIIAGDVIEHLPNPGLFLESCRDALSENGRILLTTVNSYGIVRFLKAFLFHEAVHLEHTAYYSHKTLDRLLSMSGLKPQEFAYYKCEPLSVHFSLNRLLGNLIEFTTCAIFPQFSEGVTVVGKRIQRPL